ncbi:MAG: DUF3794 domain-containing protein, partial [Oscillospiraceae bacterium]|nr:DUF3794 domain-containing protein [Oscillospiraceae bacterium]
GNITLKSKEAGSGRVSVSGAVAVSVVYAPEGEGGLRCLELNLPFTAGLDAAEVTDETQVAVTLRLAGLDARVINSRKVLVRADILIEARGFEPAAMRSTADLEDEAEQGLHVRREQVELSFASQVREKSFVLSDEFALPAGRPPIGQILKSRIRLTAEDIKNVGAKLIFKGIVSIHVMYTAQNTEEVHLFDFDASFSQIMELEGEGERASYELSLMLTNVYLESGLTEQSGLAAELHIVAQAVERRTRLLDYISDAYSTRFDLETGRAEESFESLDDREEVPAELRESIELPTAVIRVLDWGVHMGRVQMSQEDGRLQLRTSACLSVAYVTEEGQIAGLTRRFEVGAELDVRPNRSYSATATAGSDVQIHLTPSGLELRLQVRFAVAPMRRVRFAAVDRLSWDEDAPRDLTELPSVVVFHAQGGESLWNLAKRYTSTEAQIMAANMLSEDMVPYPGQMFIIPKAR